MGVPYLRQATASQSRAIGPFVDDTDFKTPEPALTIANTDIKLVVNGGASANKNSGGGTHRANGVYGITFDATDTATVGEMEVNVVVAGALPVFHKFVVIEEAIYDAMFAASAPGYLQPTTAGRTLDVTATGEAGIDWANVGAPTTTLNLSGTTVATLTNAPADSAGVTTLLSRIPAALFSGITSLAHWLGQIAGKQTPNSTAQTEIRATGAGSGTYDATTDSHEAIKDNIATTTEVAAAVTAAIQLKKNVAFPNYPFPLFLAGTRTLATGKTPSCTKLIDAASAFSATSSSAAEIGATGIYRVNLSAGDVNGNVIMFLFTASGCDPYIVTHVTQS